MAEIHDKILEELLGNKNYQGTFQPKTIESMAMDTALENIQDPEGVYLGPEVSSYPGNESKQLDQWYNEYSKASPDKFRNMNVMDIITRLNKMRGEEPKAHNNIDTIIKNNDAESILKGLIGQSYESDPGILSEHTTLLNYLAGAVSKPGSKDRYMHGIDGRELEKRMAEIESYSSTVDSSGTKRYTIPLLDPRSYPPKYEHESRSMQHWLEDYPEWINRSSINNP